MIANIPWIKIEFVFPNGETRKLSVLHVPALDEYIKFPAFKGDEESVLYFVNSVSHQIGRSPELHNSFQYTQIHLEEVKQSKEKE